MITQFTSFRKIFIGFAIVKAKAKELFLELELEANVNGLIFGGEKVPSICGRCGRTHERTKLMLDGY